MQPFVPVLLMALCLEYVDAARADDQIPYSLGKSVEQLAPHLEQGRHHASNPLRFVGTTQPCVIPGFNTPGVCYYYLDEYDRLVTQYVMSGHVVAVLDASGLSLQDLPL
jgi:hypothetical protein